MKKYAIILMFFLIMTSAIALEKSFKTLEKTTEKDDTPPQPVRGYVYDGTGNPITNGLKVQIGNLDTGEVIGEDLVVIDPYGPGSYLGFIETDPGQNGYTYAWNNTHWGQTNYTFTGDINEEDVNLTNLFPNRPPELDPVGNQQTDESSALEFTVSAQDLDGDELDYGIVEDLPSEYSFVDGIFSWIPTYYDAGIYEVTFTVTDGEYSDNETINITVIDQNGPPVLSSQEDRQLEEDQLLSIQLFATDPDNDDLQYSTSADFGTFDEDTGLFEYTPTIWDSGIYQVTFSVTDGEYFDDQQVTITVDDNGAPVQLKAFDALTAQEDSAVMIYPEPSNPNWASLELSIDSDLFIWDQELKAFRWLTPFQSDGEYDFNVTADDGQNTDHKTVHVTINNNCQFDKKTWQWDCGDELPTESEVLR